MINGFVDTKTPVAPTEQQDWNEDAVFGLASRMDHLRHRERLHLIVELQGDFLLISPFEGRADHVPLDIAEKVFPNLVKHLRENS